ncbi:MAG TPA: gamma-glutamyltransferase [Gemmatimonadaceae bacterium]|nr:gamma-glutamyltransferase [Gemmatimonadaceae bacterium]
MLRAGGNAVDAAVATAFAIGVVEPQMSGLGGSGSATIYMKQEGKPAYLDFYAAQPVDAWRGHPSLATPVPAAGTPTAAAQNEEGGTTPPGDLRVVGVPGAVAGLLALHERYGTLTRAQVMAPAIRLAEEGFPVGQVLADFIARGAERMKPFPTATAFFFPGGKPIGPGEVVKNPALAASLRRISDAGRKGFYEGPTAAALVSALNAGGHPLRLSDLASYAPQWKRPLCTAYRGYTVLSAPPPQTGLQILHALELLEPFNLRSLGLPTQSARAFDVLASALRAGQSQQRFNADPNWVAVPANGLTSSQFAASRTGVVGTGKAAATVTAADPAEFDTVAPPAECRRHEPYPAAVPLPAVTGGQQNPEDVTEQMEGGETTHLSVVDKAGNAVALTVTNSSAWGSGGMVEGFILNNSGFRFTERNIGAPSRSQWRIRNTTIAPTIVLRGSDVEVVIGAPGAGRIPTEILQVMVYVLDYGLDPLDAVRIPRIFTSAANPRVQLEHGFSPELLREVRAMGYQPVAESAGYARLYLIARRGGVWVAVADPRHDGQPKAY